MPPDPTTGCFSCKHLCKQTESWEMPHICWFECNARPGIENLRQFPFRNTQCAKREPKR